MQTTEDYQYAIQGCNRQLDDFIYAHITITKNREQALEDAKSQEEKLPTITDKIERLEIELDIAKTYLYIAERDKILAEYDKTIAEIRIERSKLETTLAEMRTINAEKQLLQAEKDIPNAEIKITQAKQALHDKQTKALAELQAEQADIAAELKSVASV